MKIFVGVAILIFIALFGARKTFTKIPIPLAAQHLYLTGTEYIFVGWCLGGQMLGLLDMKVIEGLSPLLHLALGWIGLMFGTQLELAMIKRFPKQYFYVTALEGMATVLVCFAAFFPYFYYVLKLPLNTSVVDAVALAAIAVPTGQSAMAIVIRELRKPRRRLSDLLTYVAGIDMAFGVAILGILFCYCRSDEIQNSSFVMPWVYVLSSVGMGVVMGLMLHLLTRVRCTEGELLIFTIGTVVFSAGAASYIGVSPLLVTAIGGGVIANTKGAKVRIARILAILEKPFYILILLLGGALVDVLGNWMGGLLLAIVYVAARTSGKLLGGFFASKIVTHPTPLPGGLGRGLISHGGISAALALSFTLSFGGDHSGLLLFAVFVAIAFNEMISPALVRPLVEKET